MKQSTKATQQSPPAKSKLAQLIETALIEDDRRKSWLADQSGLSRQYISQIINASPHSLTGKPVEPERETVIKIADALQRPRKIFLEACGYSEEEDARFAHLRPKARQIMEMVSAMDDDDLELARGLVRHIFAQRDQAKRNAAVVDHIGTEPVVKITAKRKAK